MPLECFLGTDSTFLIQNYGGCPSTNPLCIVNCSVRLRHAETLCTAPVMDLRVSLETCYGYRRKPAGVSVFGGLLQVELEIYCGPPFKTRTCISEEVLLLPLKPPINNFPKPIAKMVFRVFKKCLRRVVKLVPRKVS